MCLMPGTVCEDTDGIEKISWEISQKIISKQTKTHEWVHQKFDLNLNVCFQTNEQSEITIKY